MKERNSNIEVLRIAAMFFIVLSHCSYHGNFPETNSSITFNNVFLHWMLLGNLGVDIFIIISGYFLCKKDNTLKSIPGLLTQTWFYSFSFLLIAILFCKNIPSSFVVKSIFPIIYSSEWFITSYIIFLLFTPLLNRVLNCLNEKNFVTLICLMLFIWSIIPTFTFGKMDGSNFTHFLMLYIIGAYLHISENNIFQYKKIRNSLALFSFILLFASTFIIVVIFHGDGLATHFYERSSIFVITCAIGLFSIFLHAKPFHNKVINIIGKCTFGVYLIHENIFIRPFLWNSCFDLSSYYNSPFLSLLCLTSVVVIYMVCTFIEYVRTKTIEKPMLNAFIRILKKCHLNLDSISKKLTK